MKVKSLSKAIARQNKKRDINEDEVIVCQTNRYGVNSYYSLKQVRGSKHPFCKDGKLVLQMDELTSPH